MGAILDLIGSYIFKAAMIGIILATSVSLNEVMTKKAQLTNLERTMNVQLSVVDWDLRNIGTNSGTTKIYLITTGTYGTTGLRYCTDVDDNGVADTVIWSVSNSLITVGDSTVRRFTVTRKLNTGSTYTLMYRLRTVDIFFLDGAGTVLTSPYTYANIRAIRFKVMTESPFIINGEILTATRQITVFPPNLFYATQI